MKTDTFTLTTNTSRICIDADGQLLTFICAGEQHGVPPASAGRHHQLDMCSRLFRFTMSATITVDDGGWCRFLCPRAQHSSPLSSRQIEHSVLGMQHLAINSTPNIAATLGDMEEGTQSFRSRKVHRGSANLRRSMEHVVGQAHCGCRKSPECPESVWRRCPPLPCLIIRVHLCPFVVLFSSCPCMCRVSRLGSVFLSPCLRGEAKVENSGWN